MLQLDPIYHTETMVRLLKEQGSPQLAKDLAEKILEKNPALTGVRLLLEELQEEAEAKLKNFLQKGREYRETRPEGSVASEEVSHESQQD